MLCFSAIFYASDAIFEGFFDHLFDKNIESFIEKPESLQQ